MLNFYKIAIRIIAVISSVLALLIGFYFAQEADRISIFIATAVITAIYFFFAFAFAELLGAVAELQNERKQ